MTDPFTAALIAVMAHSTEPMVLSDPRLPDDPMVAANNAFERMTGYAREEIIGRNCRFLQGPKTDPESVRRIRSNIGTRRGCVEWIVNHRRDGTAFWNLLFISPIFDAGGELRYFFGNQLDITTGPPASLTEFQLGPAHMPAPAEQEFHAIVTAIAGDQGADPNLRARALERTTDAARRLSALTTQLTPDLN